MKRDVLIVGSGLAGATCGYLLARAGISALAVDCADLVSKEKLCGGMMTERSIGLAERIYGPQARGLYRQSFTSMLAMDTRVRKGSPVVRLDAHMSIVRRKDLDDFAVCRMLDAGCEVADRSRIESIDPLRHRASVRTPAGLLQVEYGHLVVADGASSHMRRVLSSFDAHLAPQPSTPLTPSLEALVEPTIKQVVGWNCPQIRGYCGYFPCGDIANVGVGGTLGTAQQMRATLDEFVTMIGAEGMHDLRGAFLPSGGSPLLQSRDASFLGDAAGLVCPVTGEGIYYALKSAYEFAGSLATGTSYEHAMAHELGNLFKQYALSKPILNDKLTVVGLRIVEALGIEPVEIPRTALRLAANFE